MGCCQSRSKPKQTGPVKLPMSALVCEGEPLSAARYNELCSAIDTLESFFKYQNLPDAYKYQVFFDNVGTNHEDVLGIVVEVASELTGFFSDLMVQVHVNVDVVIKVTEEYRQYRR